MKCKRNDVRAHACRTSSAQYRISCVIDDLYPLLVKLAVRIILDSDTRGSTVEQKYNNNVLLKYEC